MHRLHRDRKVAYFCALLNTQETNHARLTETSAPKGSNYNNYLELRVDAPPPQCQVSLIAYADTHQGWNFLWELERYSSMFLRETLHLIIHNINE